MVSLNVIHVLVDIADRLSGYTSYYLIINTATNGSKVTRGRILFPRQDPLLVYFPQGS